jgi:hypothetical protein
LGENAEGQWHVFANAVTETAHEGICERGYNGLSNTQKARLDLPKLKHGAIWNDMPSGVETDEAAMIKDGHMDVDVSAPLIPPSGLPLTSPSF